MEEMMSTRVFRSRVLDAIGEARFPAEKADILATAIRHNVPSDVLDALLKLPERRYADLTDLLTEVEPPAQA